MKTVAIAQARMGSTRFPGKVLKDLYDAPVLQWVITALRAVDPIDQIVLATSTLEQDDPIAAYCSKHKIECFRGHESDVLDRFYQAATHYEADIVIRVTCDCPFLDPRIIEEVIRLRHVTNADYCTNTDPPSYPDGLDVECFTYSALQQAHREATRPSDRDCLTQFIVRNRSRFKAVNLRCPLPGLEKERWVLDTEEDYRFCRDIAARVGMFPSYLEILRVLDKEPDLRKINPNVRNERFSQQVHEEKLPARTFERSERIQQRALQTIPFGAQTFSKSYLHFPPGRSPLFVSHGDGARVFDVDGNDYVDLVGALLPIVLGYRDPDVDNAIRNQLDRGISFSLATELEVELAETLNRLIPCAEMVKFAKSGTDVTTAAVRLARAFTGRDHVLVGGYHGWGDWSIGCSDHSLGVPKAVKGLSHKLSKIPEKFPVLPEKIAAVVIEPYDCDQEHLAIWRSWCNFHGAVLIFDEVRTGFRYALGGAQTRFKVTPDLACFGKAMGNGSPISALCGRREIMQRCQPPNNIFFSGTFFGEALSIAAAIATIAKMERENVIEYLWHCGGILERQVKQMIDAADLDQFIQLKGEAPFTTLEFKDNEIKTLFMQEMIQSGVLIINFNAITFSHGDHEMQRVLTAYWDTFYTIRKAIQTDKVSSMIKGPVAPALRESA